MVGWGYYRLYCKAMSTVTSNQNCPACQAPTHDIDGIERCIECNWVFPQGAD